MKKIYVFLIFLLVLASFLRFYDLSSESLWFDEGFTLYHIRGDVKELINLLKFDVHPPGYYLVTQFFNNMFETSELALRLPSVLFGILAVYLIFLLGKEIFDKKVGLLASLFLAISYTAVLYSQEARMYCMFMALFLLSFFCFIKFLKNPSTKNFIFLSIANALIMYTHVIGLFINIIYFMYYISCYFLNRYNNIDLTHILFRSFKARYDFKKCIYSFVLTFILYLPWVYMFFIQFSNLFIYYLKKKLIEKVGVNVYPAIMLFVLVIIFAYILLMFYFIKNKRRFNKVVSFYKKIRFNQTAFVIFFLFFIIFTFLISKFIFKPTNFIRFSLFLLPVFYIFLARFLLIIKSKKLFNFLLVLFLLSASINLYNYYTLNTKEQYREAADFITQDSDEINDVLFIHKSPYTDFTFNYYYTGNIKQVSLQYKNESYKLAETFDKEHAYLFLSHNYQTKEFFKEEMDKLYTLVNQKEFVGIKIYKYKVN